MLSSSLLPPKCQKHQKKVYLHSVRFLPKPFGADAKAWCLFKDVTLKCLTKKSSLFYWKPVFYHWFWITNCVFLLLNKIIFFFLAMQLQTDARRFMLKKNQGARKSFYLDILFLRAAVSYVVPLCKNGAAYFYLETSVRDLMKVCFQRNPVLCTGLLSTWLFELWGENKPPFLLVSIVNNSTIVLVLCFLKSAWISIQPCFHHVLWQSYVYIWRVSIITLVHTFSFSTLRLN